MARPWTRAMLRRFLRSRRGRQAARAGQARLVQALDQASAEVAAGLGCYSPGAKDRHLRAAQRALRHARPARLPAGVHPYLQPDFGEDKPRCAVCGRAAADPIHGASAK